jgi:hypothetical protein
VSSRGRPTTGGGSPMVVAVAFFPRVTGRKSALRSDLGPVSHPASYGFPSVTVAKFSQCNGFCPERGGMPSAIGAERKIYRESTCLEPCRGQSKKVTNL